MANKLEYFNKLEQYIANGNSVESFKTLYREYFGSDPDASTVANYQSNLNQSNNYEADSSYDDYYDDSYDSSYC